MDQFEKWIEGIVADQSVKEAAQHSLRARLAVAQHDLPLAANRAAEDVEYVHQLRVFTRRSMAALKREANYVRNIVSGKRKRLGQMVEDYSLWWTSELSSKFQVDFESAIEQGVAQVSS